MSPPAIPHVPDKIVLIESSLRCFFWGLLSLLPVVGMAFAIHALFLYRRASQAAPDAWNPARCYLVLGLAASLFSLVQSLGVIVLTCRVSGLGELFVD